MSRRVAGDPELFHVQAGRSEPQGTPVFCGSHLLPISHTVSRAGTWPANVCPSCRERAEAWFAGEGRA